MERLKKIVFCSTLNKDVMTTYFIADAVGTNGSTRYKMVEFYNCSDKEECGNEDICSCPCFKNLKRVEMEVNHI